jgi:hypothetical protein
VDFGQALARSVQIVDASASDKLDALNSRMVLRAKHKSSQALALSARLRSR